MQEREGTIEVQVICIPLTSLPISTAPLACFLISEEAKYSSREAIAVDRERGKLQCSLVDRRKGLIKRPESMQTR